MLRSAVVRALPIVIAIACVSSSIARAEDAAELENRGEQLAKDGRYTEAIDAFKAADAITPSARHKCLVALAYARRELWAQAEIFFSSCLAARGDASLPDWVPDEQKLIAERVAAARVAAITLGVEPRRNGVRLALSNFPPDETFAPGLVVHLPPGRYTVTATDSDGARFERSFDVTDTSPRAIAVPLRRYQSVVRPMLVGGLAALGAGVVAYGVMSIGWFELRKSDYSFGTKYETMYDVGRAASISLWAIGAGLVITSYVLKWRDRREQLAVEPTRGGALVVATWRR